MPYELVLRTIRYDAATGKVLEVSERPAGEATLEQLHGWLSTGDDRIWRQQPRPANA